MDKVSIVIPMYNAEKYLDVCIRSALEQTYENIEVLVIDDGSTDGSLDIANKYSGKITIIQKTNGGTASALNTGIESMTGEWFKWLSADDVLKPNAVADIMDAANVMGIRAKDHIFYAHHDLIDDKGDLKSTKIEKNYNDLSQFDHNVTLLNAFRASPITALMHKSIFEICGKYDEVLNRYEDAEFWIRACIAYKYRLHLVNLNVAQYRIHSTQLSGIIDRAVLEQDIDAYIKSKVFGMISKPLVLKYQEAIKKYRSPFKIRLRNVIVKIFPSRVAIWIVSTYVKCKGR